MSHRFSFSLKYRFLVWTGLDSFLSFFISLPLLTLTQCLPNVSGVTESLDQKDFQEAHWNRVFAFNRRFLEHYKAQGSQVLSGIIISSTKKCAPSNLTNNSLIVLYEIRDATLKKALYFSFVEHKHRDAVIRHAEFSNSHIVFWDIVNMVLSGNQSDIIDMISFLQKKIQTYTESISIVWVKTLIWTLITTALSPQISTASI